jgi:hypothetical protein
MGNATLKNSLLIGLLLSCAFSMQCRAENDKPDPALCRSLVKHTPDASVAYQPGVDVDGNAVAPADLPGQAQIKMPEKITIPITVSLAKTLNLDLTKYPNNQLGEGTEAVVGTFTVEGDKVSFNGQPLTDDQQDNLSVLCMQPNE